VSRFLAPLAFTTVRLRTTTQREPKSVGLRPNVDATFSGPIEHVESQTDGRTGERNVNSDWLVSFSESVCEKRIKKIEHSRNNDFRQEVNAHGSSQLATSDAFSILDMMKPSKW